MEKQLASSSDDASSIFTTTSPSMYISFFFRGQKQRLATPVSISISDRQTQLGKHSRNFVAAELKERTALLTNVRTDKRREETGVRAVVGFQLRHAMEWNCRWIVSEDDRVTTR